MSTRVWLRQGPTIAARRKRGDVTDTSASGHSHIDTPHGGKDGQGLSRPGEDERWERIPGELSKAGLASSGRRRMSSSSGGRGTIRYGCRQLIFFFNWRFCARGFACRAFGTFLLLARPRQGTVVMHISIGLLTTGPTPYTSSLSARGSSCSHRRVTKGNRSGIYSSDQIR